MFRDNMRNVAHRLIDKYGTDIVLYEAVPGAYDPSTGKNGISYKPHNVKAHIAPYQSSEIVQGVIDINDIKILIYADNWELTKDWLIGSPTQTFDIINWNSVIAQNAPITIEIQARSRAKGEIPIYKDEDYSMMISTDTGGERYLLEKVGGVKKAHVFSGSSLALEQDGHIYVPFNSMLSEEYDGSTVVNTYTLDVTNDGNGLVTGTLNADGNGYLYIRLSKTGSRGALLRDIHAGTPCKVAFGAKCGSGDCYTSVYGWGFSKQRIPQGDITIREAETVASGDATDFIKIEVNGVVGDSVTVDLNTVSVRELSPRGQILYYDHATHTHKTVQLTTTEFFKLQYVKIGHMAVLWDNQFTSNDITKIDAEPELLTRWALGEDVLSTPKEPDDKYYAVTDYTSVLTDISELSHIDIHGYHIWSDRENYGMQAMKFVMGSKSIPVAYFGDHQLLGDGNAFITLDIDGQVIYTPAVDTCISGIFSQLGTMYAQHCDGTLEIIHAGS